MSRQQGFELAGVVLVALVAIVASGSAGLISSTKVVPPTYASAAVIGILVGRVLSLRSLTAFALLVVAVAAGTYATAIRVHCEPCIPNAHCPPCVLWEQIVARALALSAVGALGALAARYAVRRD